MRRLPERTPALNDPEQHDDDGDHQEDVDQASERVGRHDPEQPQDEEDDDAFGVSNIVPTRRGLSLRTTCVVI